MKKTRPIYSFLAGMLTTLLLVSMIPSALALAGKTIQVYTGIDVYVNDQKVEPKDANGNPVEVFVYNGTTYLPIRAIGNALGLPVTYDSATVSAYVGRHESETPAVWLSQLDYFAGTPNDRFYTATSEKDNMGDSHTYCITGSFDRTYQLNGQYSAISGVLYQKYSYRSNQTYSNNSIEIYGDGRLLYTYKIENFTTGIRPVSFNVDLTGVLELRVVFSSHDNTASRGPIISLGDVGLYT